LGVSIEDVSRTLQILFGSLDLSRIKLDGKEYDVIAQLQRISRLLPQDLDRIYVRNAQGQLVQLSAIVHREEGAAANAIEHYNRLRSTTISASLNGIPLGTAIRQVEELLKEDLPPGFLHDWAGESREFTDSIGQFIFVLVLALVITYMVLAAQFESLVHPVVVILCVPLAGLGALGMLWLVGFLSKIHVLPPLVAMNINLFSMIGFVLLVGLVTKNGILLVEFANQRRATGTAAGEAMIEAGLVRLRPILMTAFLHHRRNFARRHWVRRRSRKPAPHGHHRGRRHAEQHHPDPVGHPHGLYPVQRPGHGAPKQVELARSKSKPPNWRP
jgi:multidrug efflux pump subunit AcrB